MNSRTANKYAHWSGENWEASNATSRNRYIKKNPREGIRENVTTTAKVDSKNKTSDVKQKIVLSRSLMDKIRSKKSKGASTDSQVAVATVAPRLKQEKEDEGSKDEAGNPGQTGKDNTRQTLDAVSPRNLKMSVSDEVTHTTTHAAANAATHAENKSTESGSSVVDISTAEAANGNVCSSSSSKRVSQDAGRKRNSDDVIWNVITELKDSSSDADLVNLSRAAKRWRKLRTVDWRAFARSINNTPLTDDSHHQPSAPTADIPAATELGADVLGNGSYIKSVIPCLPLGLAITGFILNVFLPGTGTILSGLAILFGCGKVRFAVKDGVKLSACCVNLWVGVSQMFTISFFLVGWFWSLVWGVHMLQLSVEQRRIKAEHKEKIVQAKTLVLLDSNIRPWYLKT